MKKNVGLVLCGLSFSLLLGNAVFAEEPETQESTEAAESTSAGDYTIAMIPKMEGITYFTLAGEGAARAGEEMGVNVIYKGPETASAADQVAIIHDFIDQGVDAICVAANDTTTVSAALLEAMDAGITVLDWDSQCAEAVTNASVYQVRDSSFGEHMIEKLVEYMGAEGQYAIITGGEDAPNLNAWISAAERYAERHFPDLELIGVPVPSEESADKAYEITLELLDSYPDLKGILGFSTPTAPGCAKAIREKGLQDQVSLVANGAESDSREFLEDGSLDCACLWDVEELGYLTIAVAKNILDGNSLTDGFSVDGMDITVSSNGHNVYYTEIGTDYMK